MLRMFKTRFFCGVATIFLLNLALNATEQNIYTKYGKKYGVSPQLLWAIAKTESNFNPMAINKNKNGTFDIGIMQINTIHLSKLSKSGIEMQHLFIPEVNIDVGAKILYDCFEKHGINYKGLNCYNGKISGNTYYRKVMYNLEKRRKYE